MGNVLEVKQNPRSNEGPSPRLVTRQQAAKYCSLSVQRFSDWVRCGRLPSAIPGTTRWDLKAIDLALDAASGISSSPISALDQWRASRDARARHAKRQL